jgi:hypothetical protein
MDQDHAYSRLHRITYYPYLHQALGNASTIRDPVHDDLALRNFLKDLTVTVNPAILSKCHALRSTGNRPQIQKDPQRLLAM